MLTREQILRKMHGFECPMYLLDSNWKPIYDQCVAAIDLTAENERLKDERKRLIENNTILSDALDRANAKLDAVRELVGDIVWSTLGLPDYWANSIYIKSLKMLGIIDEDGEET